MKYEGCCCYSIMTYHFIHCCRLYYNWIHRLKRENVEDRKIYSILCFDEVKSNFMKDSRWNACNVLCSRHLIRHTYVRWKNTLHRRIFQDAHICVDPVSRLTDISWNEFFTWQKENIQMTLTSSHDSYVIAAYKNRHVNRYYDGFETKPTATLILICIFVIIT